jgi:cbb3-type cytochrome oxidase cytochrome c subunit
MQVYVNDKPVELFPGMQVKHALLRAGKMAHLAAGLKVYDAWGHELGLDGALLEGMKIYVQEDSESCAGQRIRPIPT